MNIACVLDVADITVICTYTVRYYARSTYATAMDLCTLCPKKVYHFMFDNNFGKCEPIFKFFSPTDS